MLKRCSIMLVPVTLALTACGGSDNNTTPTPTPPPPVSMTYQGSWVAPGYGYSLSVTESALTLYQYTTDYCIEINDITNTNTAELRQYLRPLAQTSELEWYSGFGNSTFSAPGIRFERSDAVPVSCANNLLATDGSYEFDALEMWDFYTQIFSEYYLNFDLNNVNWEQVIAEAGQNLHNGSTESELFLAMAETLVPLADIHNSIQSPSGDQFNPFTKPTLTYKLIQEFAQANGLPFPLEEQYLTPEILNQLEAYVVGNYEYQWELITEYASQPSDIKTAADGKVRWFKNAGLGYLFIGSMTEYADSNSLSELEYVTQSIENAHQAINQALSDFDDINGLIIDVRTNGGGHDFVTLSIASHFTDEAFHAYSKQARHGNGRTPLIDVELAPYDGLRFTGPTVLLTSANTVSSGELFTLVLRELPQVTVVGEVTQGALSDILQWTLPNGFEVGLSNEYYLSADGQWYEKTGVPVDVNVPFFTLEQRVAGIDAGIEASIEILN